jgi:hypothetical protein
MSSCACVDVKTELVINVAATKTSIIAHIILRIVASPLECELHDADCIAGM